MGSEETGRETHNRFPLLSIEEQAALAQKHQVDVLLFCPDPWALRHRFINQDTGDVRERLPRPEHASGLPLDHLRDLKVGAGLAHQRPGLARWSIHAYHLDLLASPNPVVEHNPPRRRHPFGTPTQTP